MRRLSGLIYFDEYQEIENDAFKAFLFFAGTSMALGGIFVLTVRPLHLSRLPSPHKPLRCADQVFMRDLVTA